MQLHPTKLGAAGAIVAAACMLLLSVANALGFYQSAIEQMQRWHIFYAPDAVGTITGMIEAAIVTYIVLYAFATLYNKFLGET